jgi:hypothetical protein
LHDQFEVWNVSSFTFGFENLPNYVCRIGAGIAQLVQQLAMGMKNWGLIPGRGNIFLFFTVS